MCAKSSHWHKLTLQGYAVTNADNTKLLNLDTMQRLELPQLVPPTKTINRRVPLDHKGRVYVHFDTDTHEIHDAVTSVTDRIPCAPVTYSPTGMSFDDK